MVTVSIMVSEAAVSGLGDLNVHVIRGKDSEYCGLDERECFGYLTDLEDHHELTAHWPPILAITSLQLFLEKADVQPQVV